MRLSPFPLPFSRLCTIGPRASTLLLFNVVPIWVNFSALPRWTERRFGFNNMTDRKKGTQRSYFWQSLTPFPFNLDKEWAEEKWMAGLWGSWWWNTGRNLSVTEEWERDGSSCVLRCLVIKPRHPRGFLSQHPPVELSLFPSKILFQGKPLSNPAGPRQSQLSAAKLAVQPRQW